MDLELSELREVVRLPFLVNIRMGPLGKKQLLLEIIPKCIGVWKRKRSLERHSETLLVI
jgi:hypothetical protein